MPTKKTNYQTQPVVCQQAGSLSYPVFPCIDSALIICFVNISLVDYQKDKLASSQTKFSFSFSLSTIGTGTVAIGPRLTTPQIPAPSLGLRAWIFTPNLITATWLLLGWSLPSCLCLISCCGMHFCGYL